MRRLLLFLFPLSTTLLHAQSPVQFVSTNDNGWLVARNWSGGAVPDVTSIAVFGVDPNGSGSNGGCYINFKNSGTNDGDGRQGVGALRVLSTRTLDLVIGNSSQKVDGVLSLAGVGVNGTANVVVDNLMSSSLLNISNAIVGNSRVMKLELGNNAIFQGVNGSTTEISTEVVAAGNVFVNGGTLQLTRKGGNTFPATSNFTVNSGSLKISSSQQLNNLDLLAGSTLLVENGSSLTIHGTFTHRGATVILSGGAQLVYGTGATLVYAGAQPQTVSTNEWPETGGPKNVTITNPQGVTLATNRTITGAVTVQGILSMTTAQLSAATVTINNGARLKVGSTHPSDAISGNFSASTSLTINAGAVVEFNGTAAQASGARSYSELVINNGSGVSLTGNVTINNNLTLSAGTLAAASRTLTISGNINRVAGTIDASAGTVEFKGAAVQTIGTASFTTNLNHLTIDNPQGVTTDGNLNVLGNLALTTGTLTLGSKVLTLGGSINRIAGRIDASVGTVVCKGVSAQTIINSAFTPNLNHLIIDNPQGVTTDGNLSLVGNLTLSTGNFSLGSATLTLKGSIIAGQGKINAAQASLVFDGTSPQSISSNTFVSGINNLTLNNTAGLTTTASLKVNNLVLTAGTLSIGTSTLTLEGSINRTAGVVNAGSGTVVFAGSTAQTIAADVFSGPLNHLVIDNVSGVSNPANQTVKGTLTLNAGVYSPGAATLTLNGNVTRVAGSINATSAHIIFSGNTGQIIDADVFSGKVANLTVNNSAGVNTSADAVITGTLSLTSGTYNIGTSVHTITGNISRSAGLINAASGTLVFNGSVMQVIPVGSVTTAIKNLTVNNPGGLTINANHTISSALVLQAGSLVLNGRTVTLSGTVSGAGNFRGSATSGITIASAAAAGTLNFDQTTDAASNALASLVVSSGTAVLGNKLNLYTVLNVAGGALDLAAKSLVLKSIPENTARVAPVTGTISGATNVTVERWFPNDGRRYRLITSGVNTTTSIRANWMEGGMNTSFCASCNVNPKPGYGTQITGTGGNANGFDVTTTNNASLFTYNLATGGWTGVTSTAGTLSSTTPYLIFLRGDRSVDMTAPGSVPVLLPGSGTTLRATGTLPVGTKSVTALAAGGKTTLIANPYPSPISWANLYTANSAGFENFYNYFEPKVGQRGAYVTITNYGLNNNINSVATEQIQAGQAFFVTTKNGASPTAFHIREEDKSGIANLNVFRTPRDHIQKFYISLNFTVGDGQKFNADGVLAAYGPQFKDAVDADDAPQIASWDEDIALVRDEKLLSIETRNALTENDTIYLATARLKTGQNYEWQFTPKDMMTPVSLGYLVDNYLRKRSTISLTDTTYVPFTVTSEPASAAANRFMVVFRSEMAILPVTFSSVKAYQQPGNQNVDVEWQTSNETQLVLYEAEKSTDGRLFAKIGTVLPKNGVANVYGITDGNPREGNNYYRIKSISQDGTIKYSNVVMVKIGGTGDKFTIFPNPVQDGSLSLRFGNLPKGTYLLTMYNSAGLLVFSNRIVWNGGNGTQAVQLPSALAAGTYRVSLQGEGIKNQLLLLKD